MTRTVTLHDQGIKEIKSEVIRLAKKYKKIVKKDPNKARLLVIFKRGPITMANGEWSKLPYENLTLDPNKVIDYFKRSNLNWGILGYGSTKGGLKELMKFAKTKLNPKQLLGEKQDLNMTINKAVLIKKEDEVLGKIIVTVPDKALEGTDIQSPILEKNGYLGLKKWTEQVKGLLKNSKLDSRLKDLLENKVKLSDVVEEFEGTEESEPEEEQESEVKEDVQKALLKLKYGKDEINNIIGKVDMSKGSSEALKQALALLKKD